uniref:Programmed cell death protein 2 C-terminal domain-containing protein n=1 Tax=Opuntia streptacantha TaxID=393608 RepID=A0A7C9B2Q4_OPUST
MGEVILGLPGPWADDYLEAADHYTSKIGGLPDWPFPKSSLNHDLLKCTTCRSDLCLVSQVYAPISSGVLTIEERVIFVFGCTDVHCGSWRAIRVQKPDKCEEAEAANSEAALSAVSSASASNSKWWDDLYSFESDGEDCRDEDINMEELGRALSEAASVASGSAKETRKKHTETGGKSVSVTSKTTQVDASVLVKQMDPPRIWLLSVQVVRHYQYRRTRTEIRRIMMIKHQKSGKRKAMSMTKL